VQNDINTAAIYHHSRHPIKGKTGKHVAMVLRTPEPSEFICQVSAVYRAWMRYFSYSYWILSATFRVRTAARQLLRD
jgi:hypothetical protein